VSSVVFCAGLQLALQNRRWVGLGMPVCLLVTSNYSMAAGGVWYKGKVLKVLQSQPPHTAPLEEKERYDPWDSLVVQWDRGELQGM